MALDNALDASEARVRICSLSVFTFEVAAVVISINSLLCKSARPVSSAG